MAACQQIGAFVYDEAKRSTPGQCSVTPISPHGQMWERPSRGTCSRLPCPFSLYREMEEEAKDGVFDGPIWKGLAAERNGGNCMTDTDFREIGARLASAFQLSTRPLAVYRIGGPPGGHPADERD